MSDLSAEERAAGVCPIIDIDYRQDRAAFWNFASLNEIRESAPIVFNKTPHRGYWMVNRYDEVKEALQRPEVFTNDLVSALGDPDHHVRLLPQNLNPPEHVWYRHVVNPWFSPGTIDRIMPLARQRCIAMIEELAPKGGCDLTTDFAMIFPTEIFLAYIGLPIEDGEKMLPLIEGMFEGFFGGDPADMARVIDQVKEYFQVVVDDRLKHPRDPKTDFISYLLEAEVNGEPLPQDDVLILALTIMTAGLDTTRSQLGYIFHHLATHENHRQMLIESPELIPAAVEEFCRLYGLVMQDGRYVAQDVDFHGCPMKKGDIVWLGLAQANRDPRKFERPDDFVIDRESNKHMGFAAGAHRCLGAHLARKELVLVLEEWLTRIPHFRLATDEGIMERGGQLRLNTVPLTWET
jgi:cytochrome P450